MTNAIYEQGPRKVFRSNPSVISYHTLNIDGVRKIETIGSNLIQVFDQQKTLVFKSYSSIFPECEEEDRHLDGEPAEHGRHVLLVVVVDIDRCGGAGFLRAPSL